MNFEKAFRQFQKKWRQGKYKSQVQKGCVGVGAVCAVVLIAYFMQARQDEQAIEVLRQIRNEASEEDSNPDMVLGDQQILAQYQELFMQNPDLIGWLTIDGTSIDYPVMWTPEDPEYYSHRGFDKEDSNNGLLFMDELSSVDEFGGNVIIYGHNMKTGTIFGCLTGYKDASYYSEHPYIDFDTVYGDGQYEVFAAFSIDVVEDTSFVYNQYIDMDESTYNAYVDEVIKRSDVDSGIRPSYGGQLLTLSTCEYSSDNGRYVVVARRVED